MSSGRCVRYLRGANVVLLFALGFWFRLSSLEALPPFVGDEAWSGNQSYAFLHGEPYTFWTPTHNPTSPFHTGMVALALTVFEPRLWVLRLPSVLAGLLAVVLTDVLGRRVLDRTTARIAAVLMAVLPAQIVWSRTGVDCSQLILFSLLVIYFAFRASRVGLGLSWAACCIAHPTGLFLAPIALGIYATKACPRLREFSTQGRVLRIAGAGLAVLIVLIAGLSILSRPRTQELFATYGFGYANQHNWWEFWTWFDRLLLAIGFGDHPHHDRLFWWIMLPVAAFGGRELIRSRQWDRLALVLGVPLSAAILCLVGGSTIIQFGAHRYGLFLVTPAVLAVACLVRVLLPAPTDAPARFVRGLQVAALLALAWSLPFTIHLNDLDRNAPVDDSIWTFGGGDREIHQRTLSEILDDIQRSGTTSLPCNVIAEDWDSFQVLQFLASGRRAVRVEYLPELAPEPQVLQRFYDQLQAGAYAIGPASGSVQRLVTTWFPADCRECWNGTRNGHGLLLHHVKDPTGPGAIAERPDPNGESNVRR